MSSPSVSIIIPTYNRVEELKRTLGGVLRQSHLPLEVLIVDDSTTDEVEKAVESLRSEFTAKSIALVYLRNQREKSATIARNVGASASRGDLLMFLDDDVLLEPDYVTGILDVLRSHPCAKGVQGFRKDTPKLTISFRLLNAFDRMFLLFGYAKDRCGMMRSFNQIYPHTLTGVVECQWLSGCNHAYVRSVFEEFMFDEKLKRYTLGEDLDLSYRVHKKYPGSLYITPSSRYTHLYTPSSRAPRKELAYIQSVYMEYLFRKNIPQTLVNKTAFSWSRLGRATQAIIRRSKSRLTGEPHGQVLLSFRDLLGAYKYCREHREEIRKGDLGFISEYQGY